MRLAQDCADLCFVVSGEQEVADYAAKRGGSYPNKLVAIGSPVDLTQFDTERIYSRLEQSKEGLRFIYTGRLAKIKNVPLLIEAFYLYVQKEAPEAKLCIVGDGEEYGTVTALIAQYGLENNVSMRGAVSHQQIYGMLQESDVFLIASDGEGNSVSVLEAYASGLPVVCFEVTGLKSQVHHGSTGVVVKEKTKEAFATGISEAVKKRKSMAVQCLAEAKKYKREFIIQRIMDEIEKRSINGQQYH